MRRSFIVRCLTASLAVALGFACACAAPARTGSAQSRPWMNRSLSPGARAKLLLGAMTLDDEIALVHGTSYPTPIKAYAGYIPANTRLGIPALHLADGRAGVGDHATNVTLLPAPIGAAASWDTALMNTYGKILGAEEWGKGANVALEPTMDIVRVPEWGRSFETYGEDPYLNGQMAAAEIRGIQSAGPIANANMYLTMNQETNRMAQNSVVDERTLQEIYLPPFAAAVRQGGVGTFMCAYVKTNGIFSCENPHLLTDFLRKQLHFTGWVMSDWGATHSTLASARAGLDQEMPSGRYYGQPLKAAVESGQLSKANLNQHVLRILTTMFRHGLFDKPQRGNWSSDVRSSAHTLFSRGAAEQGMVLLTNARSLLPLSPTFSIAVIGAPGGTKPLAEGGGSSHVVAPYVVSPLDGIRHRAGKAAKVLYADGSDISEAVSVARAAHVAIVFADAPQSEGRDRPNLKLPGGQDALISAVAAANPRTVVVLNTGGAVLMPWINDVGAVLEAWYAGQEDGNAVAAVLFGDVNPSGRLPLTFPRTAGEIPTSSPQQWPGVSGNSDYSEKLDVGYRWYAARNVRPLFPFGFGLSYTSFRVSQLSISSPRIASAGQKIAASVSVTNTGHRGGAEVVEVYVRQPQANSEPPLQLCGFSKVFLKAGETERLRIGLNSHAFSIYDTGQHRWISPPGVYTILAGTSSRDLPLQAKVTVDE